VAKKKPARLTRLYGKLFAKLLAKLLAQLLAHWLKAATFSHSFDLHLFA
jgi:hypothetical protein